MFKIRIDGRRARRLTRLSLLHQVVNDFGGRAAAQMPSHKFASHFPPNRGGKTKHCRATRKDREAEARHHARHRRPEGENVREEGGRHTIPVSLFNISLGLLNRLFSDCRKRVGAREDAISQVQAAVHDNDNLQHEVGGGQRERERAC